MLSASARRSVLPRSLSALGALPRSFSAVPSTSFALPDLPYDYAALEPVRSRPPANHSYFPQQKSHAHNGGCLVR